VETAWWPTHKLYIFGKLFSGATFASEIVCLYLQSLKNYKASMFTMLKNAQNATYMVYGGRPKGTNAPSVTFLESSCRDDVKL